MVKDTERRTEKVLSFWSQITANNFLSPGLHLHETTLCFTFYSFAEPSIIPLLQKITINQHYAVKSFSKTGYEGKALNTTQATHMVNKVLPARKHEILEMKWVR